MATDRQNKVGRLVQKELADIFLRNKQVLFSNAFITVTTVRATPDLSIAKVYLSLFGVADKEALLEKIKEHGWAIRKELGARVKNQLRKVPELTFFIDDSLDYAEHIDNLLKGKK